MGTKFCGLMTMDMFVDICGFEIVQKSNTNLNIWDKYNSWIDLPTRYTILNVQPIKITSQYY